MRGCCTGQAATWTVSGLGVGRDFLSCWLLVLVLSCQLAPCLLRPQGCCKAWVAHDFTCTQRGVYERSEVMAGGGRNVIFAPTCVSILVVAPVPDWACVAGAATQIPELFLSACSCLAVGLVCLRHFCWHFCCCDKLTSHVSPLLFVVSPDKCSLAALPELW